MTEKRNSAGIIGTGWYVPEKVITNEDLEQMVDTSDAWIVERTGIHESAAWRARTSRHRTSQSARPAWPSRMPGVKAENLDLIIVATMTPDRTIPSTACILQDRLGATKAGAFDLSAACSGFAYAAATACQFIETGVYRHILVIGAEMLSKVLDWTDRNTCILFGDGAGAVVFGPVEAGYGLLSFDLGSDGAGGDLLDIPAGGSLKPLTAESLLMHENCIHMDVGKLPLRSQDPRRDGREVACARGHREVGNRLARAASGQHASVRRSAWARPEGHRRDIGKYGNMSAASIPVA